MNIQKNLISSAAGITLKQLRALQAVVTAGSLTGAARIVNLTTPAVHSQINGLENTLDSVLLVRPRNGEPFRPTAEGRELLRAADRMQAELSQGLASINALNAGKTGRVRLAAVSTGKYFAPGLVRILNDLLPDIEISLKVGNRAAIIAEMDRARHDLVIMGRPPRSQMSNAIPIGPHPHGIILPPDHRLAGSNGYDPDDLLRETFIFREPGSGTRIVAERFLDQFARGRPARNLEMDSNETIKQAVIAGLGVGMLSLHTVHRELQTGQLSTLVGYRLPIVRQWYLVTPDGRDTGAAAATLADRLVRLNGSYLPNT